MKTSWRVLKCCHRSGWSRERRAQSSVSVNKRITDKRRNFLATSSTYMSQLCLCPLQKQKRSLSSGWKKAKQALARKWFKQASWSRWSLSSLATRGWFTPTRCVQGCHNEAILHCWIPEEVPEGSSPSLSVAWGVDVPLRHHFPIHTSQKMQSPVQKDQPPVSPSPWLSLTHLCWNFQVTYTEEWAGFAWLFPRMSSR
jgi:hypothetical protein